MDVDDLIITTFCEMDDAVNTLIARLPQARLRQHGPQPTLRDSEVLCMEVIGAYLGLECDSAIYHLFPPPLCSFLSCFTHPAPHHLHAPSHQLVSPQRAPVAALAGGHAPAARLWSH